MSIASYTVGFLFLLLSTIMHITVQTRKDANEVSTYEGRELNYVVIGQIMGIIWIIIGGLLKIKEVWFSSSTLGIALEPLIVLIPFMFGGVALKILNWRKRRNS